MRWVLASLVIVATIGISPVPAQAYLKFGVRIGGRNVDIRWNEPVRYFVNDTVLRPAMVKVGSAGAVNLTTSANETAS